jgi:anti-sigma B factor antagonist
MTANPAGEHPAPDQKQRPGSPQPATAAAAAAVPPQPRLAVVTLPAEIDVSNDGQVLDMLTRALDGGTAALDGGTAVLVADASGTAFCDCSGVTALIIAGNQAAAAGARLRVAASPAVRRVLELTRADQVLDIYPTLAAALAVAGEPPAGERDGHGSAPGMAVWGA